MQEILEFIKKLLEASSFSPLVMFMENNEEFNAVFNGLYSSILSFLSGLFTNFYSSTLGFVVDSLFTMFDNSYDVIANHGITAVEILFSRFNLQSDNFTNNFIYFFIGLLFFGLFVRVSLKLFFWIINFILSFF